MLDSGLWALQTLARAKEHTVVVVNSKPLVDFLSEFEVGGRPLPMSRTTDCSEVLNAGGELSNWLLAPSSASLYFVRHQLPRWSLAYTRRRRNAKRISRPAAPDLIRGEGRIYPSTRRTTYMCDNAQIRYGIRGSFSRMMAKHAIAPLASGKPARITFSGFRNADAITRALKPLEIGRTQGRPWQCREMLKMLDLLFPSASQEADVVRLFQKLLDDKEPDVEPPFSFGQSGYRKPVEQVSSPNVKKKSESRDQPRSQPEVF